MARDQSCTDHFTSIVQRYEKDLRRFLTRYMPNQADVDDCAQETLLNIWRQEQRGLLRDDSRGYLFTTAMNVVRDFWRRDKVRHGKSHIELAEDLGDARSIGMEKQVAEREALRLIEVQLDRMKPSTKAVFLLYHVENLTSEQISARLGISVRTVEREMARALDACRSTLRGVMKDILED